MTQLQTLTPKEVSELQKKGQVLLVDIREPDEHAREHIAASALCPLSNLEARMEALSDTTSVIFYCKSGMRCGNNAEQLASRVSGKSYLMEGGLDAWKAEGLRTVKDEKAPLPMMRQVQITAGLLVLVGVILGALISPLFYALSGFVGAGLTFAGISGWCGMANLLAIMPWNQSAKTV